MKDLSKEINQLVESTIKAEVIKEMKNKKQPKVIKLNENDLLQIVSRVIAEEKQHPAEKITKKNHTESGKINKAATKEMDKATKDFAKAKKNDGANTAFHVNDEQKEFQDDFRGGGMEDIKYSEEPSKEFKERTKKQIKGEGGFPKVEKDSGAEVTKVGDDMIKKAERKAKKVEKQPMYNKDEQPTGKEKKSDEPKGGLALNESLQKELQRMNFMSKYSDKR